MLSQLLGGIGLFLLGMLLLTDGLKTAAGAALKEVLVRFTGRSGSAFLSGLTITAMVQSSSATTLATIGFVSAGLLTFTQAVGVVIGGSVGTTTTGWLVSLLGLKLSVGKLALPFIGAGALMRLVMKGRGSAIGLALAGFGLIFVGIDTLQAGMAGLAERMSPESLPAPTLFGRVLLVLIGVVLTVVMQSSSAAIATTITAFHSGTVDIDQALLLVIGASIGTTVTAALASIGASVPAKRTALAHILFNTFAGFIGFLLEPLFSFALRRMEAGGEFVTGASALAVFHTSFNLIGAALVLPAAHRLARVVTRLVPDRGPMLTRHLDQSLTGVPEVAIEAIRRTLVLCAGELLEEIRRRLTRGERPDHASLLAVRNALKETRLFLGGVPPFLTPTDRVSPRLSAVHALDHLEQLAAEVERAPDGSDTASDPNVTAARETLLKLTGAAGERLRADDGNPPLEEIESPSRAIAELRRTGRESILSNTARGDLAPAAASEILDLVRWMDGAAYHTWRAIRHLTAHEEPAAIPPATEPEN